MTAAALHTPPYPVLLTPLPAGAAPPLARALLARGRDPVGVTAEKQPTRPGSPRPGPT